MDLKEFFEKNNRVALGFSGGTDSSFLLYAGKKYGATVKAYFIKTAFQPQFEYEDAMRLAKDLDADVTVLHTDALANPDVAKNPANRCYHCKTGLFGMLKAQAIKDGFTTIIDGTNASDDATDRPGMKALEELEVLSPLRECGITKAEVRRLSKQAGLFTHDKPSYACLATRIPTDTTITNELLQRVEASEDALFKLGFDDFRVRVFNNAARIQVTAEQMGAVIEKKGSITTALKPYFDVVMLDLLPR